MDQQNDQVVQKQTASHSAFMKAPSLIGDDKPTQRSTLPAHKESLPVAPLPTYNPPAPVAPVTPIAPPSMFNPPAPVPVTPVPYTQPIPHPTMNPMYKNTLHPEVEKTVEEAFHKGIAATVMSQFPVVSIFAIFTGMKASGLVKQAEELAQTHNCALPGKNRIAKILGMVGTILGVANTITSILSLIGTIIYYVFLYYRYF